MKMASDKPVSIMFLSEHIPEAILKDISNKVTDWLNQRKTPSQIEKLVNDDIEASTHEIDIDGDYEILITKELEGNPDASEYWEDNFDIESITDFYSESHKGKANRIIYSDDNAFCHIIGVRGNPSAKKIVEYLKENGEVIMTADLVGEEPWHDDLTKDGIKTTSLEFMAHPLAVINTERHIYTKHIKKPWEKRIG